jgi:DNA polymerase III subunit beta
MTLKTMPTATKKIFTIAQADLIKAIDTVSPAIPSRPSHPVLANILIQIDSGVMTLTGFDLSIGIQTSVAIESSITEGFCLPSKLLADIVNKLDGDLSIEILESEIIVRRSKSSEYKIPFFNSDDFPALPTVDDVRSEIEATNLIESLKSVRFAASGDESKQMLTGIKVQPIGCGDLAELACTDGHRLAVSRTDSLGDLDLTIPARAIDAITRTLTKGTATIQANGEMLQVSQGSTTIVSRLLEGDYPNYRQLIPKQFANVATIDRKVLIGAIERVAIVAQQTNNIIVFSFDHEGLAIHAEAVDVGTAREEIECKCTGAIDIAFNAKYLLEGLKVFRSDSVTMNMNLPTSPVVVDASGESLEYLVMPVAIRS